MSASAAPVDERVAAATANWAPRLMSNGVDYNDFVRATAKVRRWEDWLPAWSEIGAQHERLAEEAEARGAAISAAEARVQAALAYHFGKFIAFGDPDGYRRAHQRTVANYAAAAPLLDPPAERVGIPYQGHTLWGYLRKPRGAKRAPVVLVVPGLDSVKEEFGAFEQPLLRRGLATLAFDGPGQGEAETELPIEPAYEKVASAAIDWVQSRDDLDANRIGLAGTSLGGYYAARAAANEPRLRCAVSMGGPYDFAENWDNVPPMTRQAFQERSFSPDPESARERARALTLEDAARRIQIPFLIVFGKQDPLIPYQQAERLYAEIPASDKQLAMYEDGNHVVNNMPYAYRPLVADWLAKRLGTLG